jgi:hypothetical protein
MHDFDFLFGSWRVDNRRLRRRLDNCTDWDEFVSTCRARPILDGRGNMDEFLLDAPEGRVHAATVRLFDAAAGEWSIFWTTAGAGRFDPPMVGRFEGLRGEFYGQERFQGRHVLSRFVWTVESAEACRWEQAYSEDGGRSWETNWVMTFRRQG